MKFTQTTAFICRYGSIAESIWKDWDILWEDSKADYQGHASFLAKKGSQYCFYEWWYGSCSGCDDWEAEGFDDDKIKEEMKSTALWMKSKKALMTWLNMLEGNPRSNASMEDGGGMAYGLDLLGGGLLNRINAIREYFDMPMLNPQDLAKIKEK